MFIFTNIVKKIIRNYRSIIMKVSIVIFSITFCIQYSYAAEKDDKMINGLIENKAAYSIQVKGKYYDITNATIKDFSEREASSEQIQKGVHAKFYPQENKIAVLYIDVGE